MTRMRVCLSVVATLGLAGGAAAAPAPSLGPLKPAARAHLDAAQRAAGTDFPAALLLCNMIQPGDPPFKLPSFAEMRARGGVPGQPFEAAKVFDNLYFVGLRTVSAWAVDTADGIIIIDALNSTRDMTDTVEPGLRKLGLDPARIKYVLVTHGHSDHYGGAAYLKQKYGARVLMSEADWELSQVPPNQPDRTPAPAKDMVITEGQKLTLGGQTLTLHVTPGHTLGTVSVLIPVTDKGRPHMAAYWGGTGFNFDRSPARFKMYSDSAQRFMNLALAAGADVPLSNHPENDLSTVKIDAMRANPAAPNPFVAGQDAVRRFYTAYSECAQAFEAQMS